MNSGLISSWARRCAAAALALCLAAGVGLATGGTHEGLVDAASSSSGDFGVEALLDGPGTVDLTSTPADQVDFAANGWEDEVEFSVDIDEDGLVSVNDEIVGAVPFGAVPVVQIGCFDVGGGDMLTEVTVTDAFTGDVICSDNGVVADSTARTGVATGAPVLSLTVD